MSTNKLTNDEEQLAPSGSAAQAEGYEENEGLFGFDQYAASKEEDARSDSDRPRLAIDLRLEADEVVLTPDDAGPGFEPEVAQRAFDPFYTTRAEGAGLGLALVATVAELHGGSARIHPDPGSLSGARISFPFLNPRASGPRNSPPTPALP